MHRFFIGELGLRGMVVGDTMSFPDKLAHQVRDVLHLKIGEQLVLFDNSGDEYVSTIISSSKAGVSVQLGECRVGQKEPGVRVILCQGMLKSARFEWILEKGTELGVITFVPILCHRSLSGLEDAGPSKIQRWQRIIQEATEQCGGVRLPELLPIRPLTQALNDIPAGSLAIMPWEEEQASSLHDVLQEARESATSAAGDPLTVVIFIGPEGGLTPEEVALAKRHGVKVVTLGKRILRAETAALVTVANVIYELAAFGD